MFLINAIWAAIALILAGSLYFFISRAEIRVKWGDVDSGLAYQRARKALLRMEQERYHPKNWRPSILVLSGGAYNRLHLAEYACWFTAANGIVSIGSEKAEVFSETLSIAKRMKRSLIIVACEQEQEKTQIPDGAINLWWTTVENGALLLLAFLLKKTPQWSGHTLRIIRPVAPKADVKNIEKEMREMLVDARIESEIVIVPTETPIEVVRQVMQPSAILFAGFEPADEDPAGELLSSLQQASRPSWRRHTRLQRGRCLPPSLTGG